MSLVNFNLKLPHKPALPASSTSRARLRCAAFPRLDQLLPPNLQLPWLKAGSRGSKSNRNPVLAKRDELLSLLLDPRDSSSSSSSSGKTQEARASELVDALIASELPFEESLLGGGPWVVVYTRGALQLWKATWQTGKLLSGNPGNEASQEFDPAGRNALNKAEYWGGSVYVTAAGTYEPLGDSAVMPMAVRADITGGSLHLFGVDLPLPIRGSGVFEVAYQDDTLRVFRSGGSISVQVRRSELRGRHRRRPT